MSIVRQCLNIIEGPLMVNVTRSAGDIAFHSFIQQVGMHCLITEYFCKIVFKFITLFYTDLNLVFSK